MIAGLLTETLGYDTLPTDGFEPRYLLAIEFAVRTAWGRLLNSTRLGVLQNGNEEHITIALQQELEQIRLSGDCEPFTESEFSKPIRGAEVMNYNGDKLSKKPDLTIYLHASIPRLSPSLSIYGGIFIECKLFKAGDPTTYRYAKDGIRRFVDGEYAWAMPHALMLAYVRTGQELPTALDDYFHRIRGGGRTNSEVYLVKQHPQRCKLSRHQPRTYITVHGREWEYRTGNRPGDIQIRHLWLQVKKSIT